MNQHNDVVITHFIWGEGGTFLYPNDLSFFEELKFVGQTFILR